LREQISRLSLQADGLRSQVEAYGTQIALIDEEVVSLEDLFARGYAPKTALARAQAGALAHRWGARRDRLGDRPGRGAAERGASADRPGERARPDVAGQRLAEVEQELALLNDASRRRRWRSSGPISGRRRRAWCSRGPRPCRAL
jgi:hypothetical protein